MMFSASDTGLLISSTLTYATPLIIAGMGSIMSETSGVVNIGIEGQMMIGAFSCAAAATMFGNPWVGLCAAILTGAIFGLLHALACITFKADQTISGIAINLLAPGAAIYFCKALFEGSTQTRPVDLADKLPLVLGDVFPEGSFLDYTFKNYVSVYLCLLLALCVWFLLFKTRTGLRIRAVGEHPKAAATLGVGVLRLRCFCVVLSGIFAALGGAVIPLSTVSYFFPSIISGQGFIAIAAVIFGKYRPGNTVLACLLFGFCKSLSLSLGNPKFALSVSGHLLSMIPYIITLLVLLFIGKSHAPAASGKIYDPAGH
ncbi:MAG: ABC transporter permease [Clostridiales Family XIII bacterium]|jgi:simple sugar transport system permease protein|nr:ABC transporter permease [Clostridiales Family XIII bacterium]